MERLKRILHKLKLSRRTKEFLCRLTVGICVFIIPPTVISYWVFEAFRRLDVNLITSLSGAILAWVGMFLLMMNVLIVAIEGD